MTSKYEYKLYVNTTMILYNIVNIFWEGDLVMLPKRKTATSPLPQAFEPKIQKASYNNAVQDGDATRSNLEFSIFCSPYCHMLIL